MRFRYLVVTFSLALLSNPAEARPHRHRTHQVVQECAFFCPQVAVPTPVVRSAGRAITGGGDPRPGAWCGWYLRQKFGIADKRFNLAWNWARLRPRAEAAPGHFVVWAHHVGELVSHVAGDIWVIESGNDGHAVRTRPRSIRGAVVVS